MWKTGYIDCNNNVHCYMTCSRGLYKALIIFADQRYANMLIDDPKTIWMEYKE